MGNWLLLLSLILLKQTDAQDFSRKKVKSDQRTDLLKALSALISEAKEAKATSVSPKEDSVFDGHFTSIADYDEFRQNQLRSHGRQGKNLDEENIKDAFEEFGDYDNNYEDLDEEYEIPDEDREGRQGDSLDVLRAKGLGTVRGRPGLGVGGAASNLEECLTNGFETNVREDCVEAVEVECGPVNVTRYRTEIVNRCKTLVDKTCNVTRIDVPHEVCLPTQQQICQTEFKLVEKKQYKEECHTKVQNICEEHIAVPIEVPYDVPVPYPIPTPKYHYSKPTPSSYIHHLIPDAASEPKYHQPTPPPNTYLHHTTPYAYAYSTTPIPGLHPQTTYPPGLPRHPRAHASPTTKNPAYQTTFSPSQYPTGPSCKKTVYAYDPTPTPKMSQNPLSEFIKKLDRHKSKRDVVSGPERLSGFPIGSVLTGLDTKVSKALFDIIRSQLEQSQRDKKETHPEEIHAIDPSGSNQTVTKKKEFNLSFLPQLRPFHHNSRQYHPLPLTAQHLEELLLGLPHTSPAVHPPLHDPLHQHQDSEHHHLEFTNHIHHPPVITTEELPAPYGCRAIATKTCNKVPYVVADKVPYETCKLVPSVKCHLTLKNVAELECTPVISEECNDFAKEVPYLIVEEECEEIVYDDCVEVNRKHMEEKDNLELS